MSIEVSHISKSFGSFAALNKVSIHVPGGSLLALLGPSGSGKTTLLRIIAGLETADCGSVKYEAEDVTSTPARDRQVGFVFQHYALFRHMTVFENIAFGLRVRKMKNSIISERVRELLRLVRLDGLERRFPSQLSGGQRQRVALARALAIRPKLLLLDEPFGALDAKVRQELRTWLRQLHQDIHMTTLFVTHDQEEAFEVADQVVVMNRGKIEQAGAPHEVFDHPANPFVMDFLGNVNVFQGRFHEGKVQLGGLSLDCPDHAKEGVGEARVYVRPNELDVHRTANGTQSLAARVQHVHRAGPIAKLQLANREFGINLNVEMTPERFAELAVVIGDDVFVSPRRVRVFSPEYVI
jgi:sulfate transport system ATP-binding protein